MVVYILNKMIINNIFFISLIFLLILNMMFWIFLNRKLKLNNIDYMKYIYIKFQSNNNKK